MASITERSEGSPLAEEEDETNVSKRKKQVQKKSVSEDDGSGDTEPGADLLELLDEVHEIGSPEYSSDEEEEENEVSDEKDSSFDKDEEEEVEGLVDEDVSIISEDHAERRYLLGNDSFTHLEDPGLEDALVLVETKSEKEYKGIAEERHDYKKLCEELGVIPCAKFLRNIHSAVMDLSYMGLNQNAMIAICKSLCNNVHVQTLILRGNDIGGVAGEALAELLESNYTIHQLNIARTNIIKSMKRICEVLTTNVKLEILDISRNDLTDKEMTYLSNVLDESLDLRELYLSRNYIEDEGLLLLSKGVKENVKSGNLEVLDLAFNRIWGGKDSLPFYTELAKSTTLRRLDLEGNSIKDTVGKALAKIMTFKKSELEYVNLSYNLLTQASCGVLGKAFARSRTIKEFIAGPNRWQVGPLTQSYLANMVSPLIGSQANPNAELLDLSLITPIHSQFIRPNQTLTKKRPEIKVIHGERFGFSAGIRPNKHRLLIRRAKVICENFETSLSMLIDELRTEPEELSPKLFKKFIKSCNLYKDNKMTKEFIDNFQVKDGTDVDCKAIIEAYDKEFPNLNKKMVMNEETGNETEVVVTRHMSTLLKW